MKQSTKFITVDDLAKNVLSADVEEAFPNLDVGVEIEKAGVNISIDPLEVKIGKIRIDLQLSGFQIAIAMVVVGLGTILTQLIMSK